MIAKAQSPSADNKNRTSTNTLDAASQKILGESASMIKISKEQFLAEQQKLQRSQVGNLEDSITNQNKNIENPNSTPTPILQTTRYVNDYIGLVSEEFAINLEQQLQQFAKTRGSQIIIWIIDNTGAETIDEYGLRLATELKVGRREIDDGVVLVIAPKNPPSQRRLYIGVGKGLEGALTDVWASRLIRQIIAPAFRQNQYEVGIQKAILHLMAQISGENLPLPDIKPLQENQSDEMADQIIIFIILLILITYLSRRKRLHFRTINGQYPRSQSGFGGPIFIPSNWGSVDGQSYNLPSHSGEHFSGGGGGFGGGGASGDW